LKSISTFSSIKILQKFFEHRKGVLETETIISEIQKCFGVNLRQNTFLWAGRLILFLIKKNLRNCETHLYTSTGEKVGSA
jgi:hypothetical protein